MPRKKKAEEPIEEQGTQYLHSTDLRYMEEASYKEQIRKLQEAIVNWDLRYSNLESTAAKLKIKIKELELERLQQRNTAERDRHVIQTKNIKKKYKKVKKCKVLKVIMTFNNETYISKSTKVDEARFLKTCVSQY